MSFEIQLRPAALNDILAAREWYEAQRTGLGFNFANELERVLDRIQLNPELYAAVYKSIRRVKLSRFPYVVYYRIEPNVIHILAVLHGHRDPRLWRGRE